MLTAIYVNKNKFWFVSRSTCSIQDVYLEKGYAGKFYWITLNLPPGFSPRWTARAKVVKKMFFDFKLSIKTFSKTQFIACAAENFMAFPPTREWEKAREREKGGANSFKMLSVLPFLSPLHVTTQVLTFISSRSGRIKFSKVQNPDPLFWK